MCDHARKGKKIQSALPLGKDEHGILRLSLVNASDPEAPKICEIKIIWSVWLV